MSSSSLFSRNRFTEIFTEDEGDKNSALSDIQLALSSDSSKKTTLSSTPVLTGSSLSKVNALLKLREAEKKRHAEELDARKKAADEAARLAAETEQKRKAEILAKRAAIKERKSSPKVNDGFEVIKKDNRKKPHQHHRADVQNPDEPTTRQVRRAHDREDRTGIRVSSKKGHTGQKESLEPVISEAVEEVTAAPVKEAFVEITAQVSESASPSPVPPLSPKGSVMTLEEYLSTKSTLVLDLPKRPANEGSGPNQFEKATPFVRMSESFLGFSIKDDSASKYTSVSPTASSSRGGSFVVDPRLQPVFSKPSQKSSKPKRNNGDKKAIKK